MLSSIRWTLQLWHAAILLLAVVGIGLTAYLAIEHARYQEVDAELEAAGQLMVARLRAPLPFRGPPPLDQFGMDMGSGPMERSADRPADRPMDRAADRRGSNDVPPFDGPPPDGPGAEPPQFGDHHRGTPPDRLPRDLNMPPGLIQRYIGDPLDARSFVIFKNDRSIAKAWGVAYDKANLPTGNIRPKEGLMIHRQRGALHELYLAGPGGSTVLVAGSVQRVNQELHQLLAQMGVAAAGVLLLGSVGAWLILGRVVRPIRRMSDTAGAISATRLSDRIDSRKVPSELRELAMVLNGMFERLEIAFQQQSRFTADASHELRTPLAVILSHTELAMSRDRSPEEYRRTIETCSAAASRMKSLVESLLLLSHADVGELALRPCPMDLSDVVRENVQLLATLAAGRSITLATQLQNATLIGDPSRLGQVVANLLSNAIRYNHDGGSIAVTTEVLLGDAVLTVADTGAGISAEDQKHVFDRFFRADKARSRDAGGSGLGLAICRSIVEAHGGSVEVTSELGVGTTFVVRVPRQIEDPTLSLPEKIEV
jgi:heavy metal sensor kinase